MGASSDNVEVLALALESVAVLMVTTEDDCLSRLGFFLARVFDSDGGEQRGTDLLDAVDKFDEAVEVRALYS